MFDFEMRFLPIHDLTSSSIQENVINENNSYVPIFNLHTEIYSLALICKFAQDGLNDNHVGFFPNKLMKDLIFFLFLERSLSQNCLVVKCMQVRFSYDPFNVKFRMSWLNE